MTVGPTAPALSSAERAEIDELRASQPGLWLRAVEEKYLVFRGRLSLADAGGREIDAYLVEVRVPRHDRPGLPKVFERGGRIPVKADRHVFTDASCCIEYPVEYLLRPRQRLAEYVNGQVRSYFIAQSYFEQFNAWPHGELGHDHVGTREFSASRFGDVDTSVVAGALELIDRPGGKHAPCPCGSRRKFLKCHYGVMRAAKGWPAVARSLLCRLIRIGG